jgi:gamma-glutamyl:cysteine ligase YbdK (ATP-grasp superfamily)
MLNNSMSDELLKQIKVIAYEQGVKDTLMQLREVYGEGLELTDLWREYMKEETN